MLKRGNSLDGSDAGEIQGAFFDPEISRMLIEENRLPLITDERKPWTYRGWAIPYIAQCHGMEDIPDRWGYYMATVENGGLLDQPIPRMQFDSCYNTPGWKALEKYELIVERDGNAWSSFNHLVDWLAWSTGASGEPPKMSEETNEQLYREVDFSLWLKRPSDYLGEYLAARKAGGWNPKGFYPTPHPVCEMMAQMTMGIDEDGKDLRLAMVCDPCVGSGRMLLHASNYSLCLYGQDVDAVVLKMCQINGALYAPWMTFPLPASILGRSTPEPPPAPLPVPEEHRSETAMRIDDHGQGVLFE